MQENIEQKEETIQDAIATEIKDPKKVLDALERAKSDAKKYRQEKEQLEKQYEEAIKQLNTYSSELLKNGVIKELESNNLNNSERLLKYIDISKLSLTENNQIIGLDDQIESLKNDFPELFDPKIRVGGKANTAADNPVKTTQSVSELQARYILGKI